MKRGSWNSDDSGRPRWGLETQLVKDYEYRHADGTYAYTVRKGRNPDGDKCFITKRKNLKPFGDRIEPEDKAEFFSGMGDERAILFRLPELIAATQTPGTRVLVPEGEKDAETAVYLGYVATCNPFGALKWLDEFVPYLAGCDLIICQDNDDDDRGHHHALQVAAKVTGHAKRVRILSFSGHKDLTEWKEAREKAGLSKEEIRAELDALIDGTAEVALHDEQAQRAEQIARNIVIGDEVTEPIFPAIMTLDEMHHRLVFVGSGGVVDRATGRIRKKETAADEYAASVHRYVTKDGTQKQGPALKFWIASPQRVTVDELTWVPGAPQICRSPEPTFATAIAFNSWRGIAPMPAPEDWERRAALFLDHVEFLVPVEAERQRFLQWLAHIVQHPEVLPHTAYLMTTKMTGIGRNLMASIIVRTLRGHVAAGISLPNILDGGFTGRLSRKLLAIVDEAREGSGERRYQREQQMRRLLTEEHRHINPKYGIESIEKNCCRWLMFSNHRDAIPFDNYDRRIIVIDNPTEPKPTEYYERLFGLLGDAAFIGSVRRLLETMDITSFRPGAHAPMNAAKVHALYAMMSETERAVLEFKEDCKTDLTSRDAIRDRVVSWSDIGKVNEKHLTYAIARAGMVSTGTRVRINEILRSVVIVRGNWTPEGVEKVSTEELIAAGLGNPG